MAPSASCGRSELAFSGARPSAANRKSRRRQGNTALPQASGEPVGLAARAILSNGPDLFPAIPSCDSSGRLAHLARQRKATPAAKEYP